MSEAGVCSRREADRLIEAGKVTVDGVKATVGMQIEEGQKVCLNGKPVQKDKKDKLILLAVNKPRGVVCSEKSQGGDVNIIDFLHYPKRITYVGRLDKDSEGVYESAGTAAGGKSGRKDDAVGRYSDEYPSQCQHQPSGRYDDSGKYERYCGSDEGSERQSERAERVL